jgi:hypothetical protein
MKTETKPVVPYEDRAAALGRLVERSHNSDYDRWERTLVVEHAKFPGKRLIIEVCSTEQRDPGVRCLWASGGFEGEEHRAFVMPFAIRLTDDVEPHVQRIGSLVVSILERI